MDPFSRYLLALHLAFAMPDSPPAIFTPPGVPSPSAPGAVHASPSPSPATPAVIHAPPLAGGSRMVITGASVASANRELIYAGIIGGKDSWTSDGDPSTDAAFGRAVLYWDNVNLLWKYDSSTSTFIDYFIRTPDDTETPDLATGWLSGGSPITPQPTFTAESALSVPPVIHSPPGHTPGTPGAIHSAPSASPGSPPVITP